MSDLMPPTLHTITSAVAKNVAVVREHTAAMLMAVVKADGYGHGMVSIARTAVAAGAQWLGTTGLDEAIQLREAGLNVPILSWLNPSGVDAAAALRHRIDIAVGSVDELDALLGSGPSSSALNVHLHVDTGMSREGGALSQWGDFFGSASRAQQRERIHVVGLMGHLPYVDEGAPDRNSAAVALMRQARQRALRAELPIGVTHLAATSGAFTYPSSHFDMVRVGAGLVGIDPTQTTPLYGASRLTAPVVHSAKIPANAPVGYGGAHVTNQETCVSVIPLGYADGIPRELSPDACVAIGAHRYSVIGRVSMDQIIIDTGADYLPLGATVTVFGPADEGAPTIHDWAGWAGTIPHTIVTGIGQRVHRRIE